MSISINFPTFDVNWTDHRDPVQAIQVATAFWPPDLLMDDTTRATGNIFIHQQTKPEAKTTPDCCSIQSGHGPTIGLKTQHHHQSAVSLTLP